MRASVASCFVVLAFAFAGCGGSAPVGSAKPGATASSDSSGRTTPSVPGQSGSGANGLPSTFPSTVTHPTPSPGFKSPRPEDMPTTVKGMQAPPLQFTLATTCSTPGGTQTLTVKSLEGFQVSYGTAYGDGTSQYGGAGVGVIPPGGIFTFTWTIRSDAPIGDARTDVAVAGKIDHKDAAAFAHKGWRIAKSC